VVEGRFPIEARKEGYIPVRRRLQDIEWVTVGGESEEVRLVLARQSRLSGRIVEQETGRPVAGIEVQALIAFYQDGRRALFPNPALAKSDSQGRFVFDSLFPTQYFLRVEADAEVRESILLNTSAEELDKAAHGRLRTTWPDVRDLQAAVPFLLDSGASLDVGELLLSKGATYRALVHLHGADCGPGETVKARLSQSLGWLPSFMAFGSVPCNGEFLIRGLTPGTHDLVVWVEGPDSDRRRFGHSTLTVVDRNLALDVFLSQGVSGTGKVVAPEQAKLPTGLVIRLLPLPGIGLPNDYKTAVKADGAFAFPSLQSTPHRMVLSGLGTGFYVKSMEYNGVAFEDNIVPFNPFSQSHSVTVVLGDGPATLRGRVTEDDKPAREPYVVLLPWPAHDPYAQSQQSRGDRDGRFAFTGLAPGEYRVVAYLEADGDKLDEPGVLPLLLQRAKEVSLQERSIQNIDVDLTRP
jgi:hypothetical protein